MLAPDKIVFLYGTKTSIPLLCATKEIGESEYSMKITVATFSAILFVSGFSPLAHAQAQIAVPGIGEVTIGRPPPPASSARVWPSPSARVCGTLRAPQAQRARASRTGRLHALRPGSRKTRAPARGSAKRTGSMLEALKFD